jgi:hypothetical protein
MKPNDAYKAPTPVWTICHDSGTQQEFDGLPIDPKVEALMKSVLTQVDSILELHKIIVAGLSQPMYIIKSKE